MHRDDLTGNAQTIRSTNTNENNTLPDTILKSLDEEARTSE